MGFLRLNKNQIGLESVGNAHIDKTDPILESNLTLSFPTADLDGRIVDLETYNSTLVDKHVAVFGQIVNVAVVSGNVSVTGIDTSIALVYPGSLDDSNGSSSAAGIITSSPFNKVMVKLTSTGEPIEYAEGGPDVYGRLTYDVGAAVGSKYTVSFFWNDGTEHAFTIPENMNIDVLIPMSLTIPNIPFESLTHGVAFVDGLPAAHLHPVSAVTGLQDELDDINSDISDLDTRVTTAEGDISDLDTRVTTAEGNISTLQTDVGALEESSVAITDVALLPAIIEGVDLSAQADGVLATFVVGSAFVADKLRVFVNGSRQVRGIQYTETAAAGTFTFDAANIPVSTDSVTVDYIAAA